MGAPTEKELIVLAKFRKLVTAKLELGEDEQHDMFLFLLGWLRARDLDLEKAFVILQKSLEWKKANDIYNILEWTPPIVFSTEFETYPCGSTSDGCPVLLVPVGKHDTRKAVESGLRNELLKYVNFQVKQINLQMKENSKALGHDVTQFVLIFDFDGFEMRQLASFKTLNTQLEMVKRYEANYPEVLAGRIFTMLAKLIKPPLSTRTLEKIKIYGTNQEEWKKALQATKPLNELPSQYRDLNRNKANSESGNYTIARVDPGKCLKVEFNVQQAKTVLSWNFKTVDFDIGFCILFNDDHGEQEVYSLARFDSHLFEQNGSICCEKFGKYSLIFDNTHSRFRGKTLNYRVNLRIPDSS